MAKIDHTLEEILKKYHPNPRNAVWNCHGVWVAYHKDLEVIARAAEIWFDPPAIIEADAGKKIAAICVTGHMGKFKEWSIGEAAPGNNKNVYPYAMAEKRAKDRVILKLIGLHGQVYSEEEADNFGLNVTKLKEAAREFADNVKNCETSRDLDDLVSTNQDMLDQLEHDLPTWFYGDDGKDIRGAQGTIADKLEELKQKELT